MTTHEAVSGMKAILEETAHLIRAYSVMYWDEATGDGAPPKGAGARNGTKGYLAERAFRLSVSPEMKALIDRLEADKAALSGPEAAMLRVCKRGYERNLAVPPEEFRAFTELTAESEQVWREAKLDNDFTRMEPYFEKIFAFQHKLAGYYGYKDHPYDALLDSYEEGLTVKTLDGFFSALRAEIVPLLARIAEKGGTEPDVFKGKRFPEDRQALLGRGLALTMGLDPRRCKFGTTEHPFMLSVCLDDTRITTHYYEEDPLSAMFSTLHEGGHAMYELGMGPELEAFGLREAASTAFHESQSRAYENMFGRSRPFMDTLLPRLRALFPDEMRGVDEEALYRACNVARPSLIRVEADELTYCLHIMIRYELEKGLMEGAIKVKDLPGLWNENVREILGLTPPDDRRGVLQDTHWPGGMVGYFPSYALGNAYAAQLVAAMRKEVDVDGALGRGDFAPINAWLGGHVHTHGQTYTPAELIVKATGEPLNPAHYTNYLREKFSAVYGL